MEESKHSEFLCMLGWKDLENDTRIVEHLKKHTDVSRTLGLCRVPDRTTVGRWWRRYLNILEQTFVNTADMLQLIEPTSIVVVDSTPLVDLYEKDRKIESSWFLKARRIRFSEMRRLL